MAKIMIQGTASSVGKSILVTALCRIFTQDGYRVAPYKSQNMSLNSYITLDGREMGRAQVLQAYACGLEPEVYMNPILLKPSSEKKCQIIVNGRVYGNADAVEYHNLKLEFKDMLKSQFEDLEKRFDIIVMEGAGSPAEINLRDRDIVNMGMAELVDAPVLIAGDIDKGGVFASLAGTMLLLNEEERKRVKGTIINKFRGDVDILKPGLKMLEDIIHIPCLGVVPYFNLELEDEDSAVEFNRKVNNIIDIAVIKLPMMSNFTDFDALKSEEDVSLRYISSIEDFGKPDLLILPGSKNTIDDLIRIRKSGLENMIKEYCNEGMIIGICGGYQMLGKSIRDPYEVEAACKETDGIGLLDIHTVFEREKSTNRVNADLFSYRMKEKCSIYVSEKDERKPDVYGYEIHMGTSEYEKGSQPLFFINQKNNMAAGYCDGAINAKGNVMGTYIHGIFDSTFFREYVLNTVREKKGLEFKQSKVYERIRDRELDKLAEIVRNSINVNDIYKIMGLKND